MSSTNKPRADGDAYSEEPEKPTPGEPSLSELLGAAKKGNPATDGSIDDIRQRLTEQRLKERETERVGMRKYYELRDKWSGYIRSYVWAMLAFQFVLTLFIGFGWFDFTKYPFFINFVIGQNFAQVVGMGVIVVTSLFSSPKKDH